VADGSSATERAASTASHSKQPSCGRGGLAILGMHNMAKLPQLVNGLDVSPEISRRLQRRLVSLV